MHVDIAKGGRKPVRYKQNPTRLLGRRKMPKWYVWQIPSVSLIEQIAPIRIPFIYKVSNLQRSSFQHLAMNGCHCSFRNILFENLGRREILSIGCAYPGVLVEFFSFLFNAWEYNLSVYYNYYYYYFKIFELCYEICRFYVCWDVGFPTVPKLMIGVI